MHKDNFDKGIDIGITENPLGFIYGKDVFGPTVENRWLDDIRSSLLDPKCEGPDIVYSIAMDVDYLVPEFYRNGWLALTLVMVEDEDEYIVLSVNLEEMDALGLPDRTFIDVNHYPEAMEFLVKNGLATDSEYKRRSGFVEYPMAMLNLPLLYQHNPQIFQKANIELFGEECF